MYFNLNFEFLTYSALLISISASWYEAQQPEVKKSKNKKKRNQNRYYIG